MALCLLAATRSGLAGKRIGTAKENFNQQTALYNSNASKMFEYPGQ